MYQNKQIIVNAIVDKEINTNPLLGNMDEDNILLNINQLKEPDIVSVGMGPKDDLNYEDEFFNEINMILFNEETQSLKNSVNYEIKKSYTGLG